jgi:hypothetical protein
MRRIETVPSLTSFSPNENTGTRSALKKYLDIGFWDLTLCIHLPVLDRDLDKPQSMVRLSYANSWCSRDTNAYLRFNVRSAVPGLALKLSAAPPTTIVIAWPAPLERILEQDCLETLLIPRDRITSRYKGTWKLLVRVSKCGLIPGKALEKPVADEGHVRRWRR